MGGRPLVLPLRGRPDPRGARRWAMGALYRRESEPLATRPVGCARAKLHREGSRVPLPRKLLDDARQPRARCREPSGGRREGKAELLPQADGLGSPAVLRPPDGMGHQADRIERPRIRGLFRDDRNVESRVHGEPCGADDHHDRRRRLRERRRRRDDSMGPDPARRGRSCGNAESAGDATGCKSHVRRRRARNARMGHEASRRPDE